MPVCRRCAVRECNLDCFRFFYSGLGVQLLCLHPIDHVSVCFLDHTGQSITFPPTVPFLSPIALLTVRAETFMVVSSYGLLSLQLRQSIPMLSLPAFKLPSKNDDRPLSTGRPRFQGRRSCHRRDRVPLSARTRGHEHTICDPSTLG